jgi:hypothetical protein
LNSILVFQSIFGVAMSIKTLFAKTIYAETTFGPGFAVFLIPTLLSLTSIKGDCYIFVRRFFFSLCRQFVEAFSAGEQKNFRVDLFFLSSLLSAAELIKNVKYVDKNYSLCPCICELEM